MNNLWRGIAITGMWIGTGLMYMNASSVESAPAAVMFLAVATMVVAIAGVKN